MDEGEQGGIAYGSRDDRLLLPRQPGCVGCRAGAWRETSATRWFGIIECGRNARGHAEQLWDGGMLAIAGNARLQMTHGHLS